MNKSSVSLLRGVFAVLLISVITAAPASAVPEKVLAKFDANKDGKLDEAETAKWEAAKKAAAEKKAANAAKKSAAE